MFRRLHLSIVLLITILSLAAPAFAVDFCGADLVLPVAGRTPGANGSQWRTDLVITNRSRIKPATVEIRFTTIGSEPQTRIRTLGPRATARLMDVIKSEFLWESTVGMIEIHSATGEPISAHARIYNVGNSIGQFGQTVTALPKSRLGKQNVLSGLTGVDGNRSNIGIANPNDERANVWISWFDRDGEFRGAVSISIEPHTLRMYEDIYDKTGTPPDDGMIVEITSSVPVFAWGSVARNDTNDSYFLMGESPDVTTN